ncbi:putative dioxygenase [Sclerotinia borealis F-4128]|uniref:Putative dioxygenase n=1 Tax=Sclerotinia borealis (strain F-4128) TaxID=1432307 RepID=W9BYL8_SCLBF|nr:putative dioxygenase [Sclerotinia borealis F-4128]
MGPASYKIERSPQKDFEVSHWFDGFGETHRFQIIVNNGGKPKVIYTSRHQDDELTNTIRQSGTYSFITFAQKRDPCIGIFGKVMSFFERILTKPFANNVNVAIYPNMRIKSNQRGVLRGTPKHSSGVDSLWLTTDCSILKELDPLTLEPIGVEYQTALHPLLSGPLSCAHAMSDPITGDVYNYNLNFGRFATYRVFRVSASSGETESLAAIAGAGVEPAYLHSFFITADFVILCVWGARLDHCGFNIFLGWNVLDAINPFDPSKPVRWFVIDRKAGRGVVAEFQSPAAFCFHTVNAWQTVNAEGQIDIVCEYLEYQNLDILYEFYYYEIVSTSKQAVSRKGIDSHAALTKYCLSNIRGKILDRKVGDEIPHAKLVLQIPRAGELPTINPNFSMRESKFLYTVVNRGYSTFMDGILKVDTMNSTTIILGESGWSYSWGGNLHP